MLNTLFCFINQKPKTKTLRLYWSRLFSTWLIMLWVSLTSYLKARSFLLFHSCTSHSDLDICGHGISLYFFKKSGFWGPRVFWKVVSDMSGWLGLKTAEKVSHIITVQFLWSWSPCVSLPRSWMLRQSSPPDLEDKTWWNVPFKKSKKKTKHL